MNALIYLKRQGLEIYSSGKSKLTFDFTSEMVAAEEIKDKEKLRAQLTDFLATNKLSNADITIVLAEELTFQKNLTEKAQLLGEVPFPAEKVISKDYPAKNLVIAANGELFSLFSNVNFIVPITLLGVSIIDENNFQQILNNKSLLKQASLLDTQDTKRNIDLKKMLLILGLAVLLICGGLLYYFRPAKKVAIVELKIPAQQVVETKQATVSAVINQKAKRDLAVKVFNGTGGMGDAKKVKDALIALGYQNIETDNLEVQNATTSAVSVKETVKEEFKQEVVSALQKLFKSVVPQSASPSSNFDILITTGK